MTTNQVFTKELAESFNLTSLAQIAEAADSFAEVVKCRGACFTDWKEIAELAKARTKFMTLADACRDMIALANQE